MITPSKSKVFTAISLIAAGSAILYFSSLPFPFSTSSSSSSTTTQHTKTRKRNAVETQQRHLIVSDAVNTVLSSFLKALFESPLSGATIKTVSCFAAFKLAGVDFTQIDL